MEAGQAHHSAVSRHLLSLLPRPIQHWQCQDLERLDTQRSLVRGAYIDLTVHHRAFRFLGRLRRVRGALEYPAEKAAAVEMDRLSHVLLGRSDYRARGHP